MQINLLLVHVFRLSFTSTMFYVKRKHLVCILLLSLGAMFSGAVTLTTSAQYGEDVCFGDVVQLTCTTRRNLTEYLASGRTYWTEDDNEDRLPNTPPYSFQSSNWSLLTVNFTREHFQERTTYSYQCYYIFKNTSLDESGVVSIVTGPARPSTPSLLGPVNITESAAVLSLSQDKRCFEDCSFHFDVALISTALGSQATFTSNTSQVVLSGLKAAYSYRADITSVCSGGEGQLESRSEPLVMEFFVGPGTTESSTTDTNPAPIVAGVVAFVVIILVLLVAILLVVMVMYRRRKSTPPPTQPSRGEVPSYQDSKEEVSYQAVNYAELDFGKPSERPIKPPPLETVIYTEAGGTIALPKEEKPPKVPEKKKNMVATGKGAFVKDVLAVMDGTGVLLLADNGSCIRDDCSEGKCDHKKLQTFRADAVARYKDTTFAANCLEEPGVEVTKKDVQRIIAIRKGLGVDKALLICNQEFMSMDLLIDLEKERCFFVPTANHGKEGWDNTFLSKFTALFA